LRKQKENVKVNIMATAKNDWKSREVVSLWDKGNFCAGKMVFKNLDFSKLSKDSVLDVVMFETREQNEQGTRPQYSLYLSVDRDTGKIAYEPRSNTSSAQGSKYTKSAQSSTQAQNDSSDHQADEDGVDALFG
jgi:hypothetical protein